MSPAAPTPPAGGAHPRPHRDAEVTVAEAAGCVMLGIIPGCRMTLRTSPLLSRLLSLLLLGLVVATALPASAAEPADDPRWLSEAYVRSTRVTRAGGLVALSGVGAGALSTALILQGSNSGPFVLLPVGIVGEFTGGTAVVAGPAMIAGGSLRQARLINHAGGEVSTSAGRWAWGLWGTGAGLAAIGLVASSNEQIFVPLELTGAAFALSAYGPAAAQASANRRARGSAPGFYGGDTDEPPLPSFGLLVVPEREGGGQVLLTMQF